jgi:hypothetical protein
MIGSRKIENCAECSKVADGQTCSVCEGVGKVDVGRIYNILSSSGPISISDLQNTSIRVPDAINPDPVACPKWFNNGVLYDMSTKQGIKKARQKRERSAVAAEQQEAPPQKKAKSPLDPIPLSDSRFSAINAFLKKHFMKRCGDKGFKITKIVGGKVYFVNTDCTYCENKGGNHNSSTIYFVVTPKSVLLKCHCPCPPTDPDRPPCSEYTGEPVKISGQLRNKLFVKKKASASHQPIDQDLLPLTGRKINFAQGWTTKQERDVGMNILHKLISDLRSDSAVI